MTASRTSVSSSTAPTRITNPQVDSLLWQVQVGDLTGSAKNRIQTEFAPTLLEGAYKVIVSNQPLRPKTQKPVEVVPIALNQAHPWAYPKGVMYIQSFDDSRILTIHKN